jgi:hypothetical protein
MVQSSNVGVNRTGSSSAPGGRLIASPVRAKTDEPQRWRTCRPLRLAVSPLIATCWSEEMAAAKKGAP